MATVPQLGGLICSDRTVECCDLAHVGYVHSIGEMFAWAVQQNPTMAGYRSSDDMLAQGISSLVRAALISQDTGHPALPARVRSIGEKKNQPVVIESASVTVLFDADGQQAENAHKKLETPASKRMCLVRVCPIAGAIPAMLSSDNVKARAMLIVCITPQSSRAWLEHAHVHEHLQVTVPYVYARSPASEQAGETGAICVGHWLWPILSSLSSSDIAFLGAEPLDRFLARRICRHCGGELSCTRASDFYDAPGWLVRKSMVASPSGLSTTPNYGI
nr:hypothetical protein CFP56_21892 [Quercus suber]